MNRVLESVAGIAVGVILAFLPAFSMPIDSATAITELALSYRHPTEPDVEVLGAFAEIAAITLEPAEIIEADVELAETTTGSETLASQPLATAAPTAPTPPTQPAAPTRCPERLVIASLGIDNCITNYTVSQLNTTPSRASGQVANISSAGARFIYGHNSSNIFAGLGRAQHGAIVQVITPAGTETYSVNLSRSHIDFRYRCLSARNVNNLSDIAAYRAANCPRLITMSSLIYAPAGTLTLMTCAGSHDPALKTHNRRHIIIAERL